MYHLKEPYMECQTLV